MPRPKKLRKINGIPHFKGFKPIGDQPEEPPVFLNLEEYEAIRLSDFEFLDQEESAKAMNVSRPTFTRIYESARRKVALAFVKGRPIVFEGGKIYFDSKWFICHRCGCSFNILHNQTTVIRCALCGSENIEQYKNSSL